MSLDSHREAGGIVRRAKASAERLVETGASALEVAEAVEETIRSEGGEPAFPCNVSVNEVAAHYTPSHEDGPVFRDGDLVKVDVGAHVDGYIADSAFTVSLGGDSELVEAAEEGLRAGIDSVESGANTGDVGSAIEEGIEGIGCRPVVNLTGHGLERYVQHAEPTIPNVSRGTGVELEEGAVVAIEPFTTRGSGRVEESIGGEIYSLTDEDARVRGRNGRKILEEIEPYRTLPFARRWLPTGGRVDLGLRTLVKAEVLRNYPVLMEVSGATIAQAEETVVVQEGGCEVITT